ncbi:MAG: phage/plasmid primase, P4 family [Candidatus Melainabacteria bacterium]|nr:phage/plasmid primase, P4 family [Candidatus Melainabacteria bacterium]
MSLAEQIARVFDPSYKVGKGGEFLCSCPNRGGHSNGDKNKSFSIADDESKPFKVKFNCFVCGVKPLIQLIKDTGLLPSSGKKSSEKKGSHAEEQARLKREKQKAKEEAKAKKAKPAKEQESEEPGEEYLFATYPYDDETGAPFVRVLRFNTRNSKKKRFVPQVLTGGVWTTGLGDHFVPLQYVRDVRQAAKKGDRIYVVEGEKKVQILRDFGVVATTNISGANRAWEYYWTLSLLGGDIVVISDNNKVGRAHAVEICKSIFEAGGRVKLVMLPNLPDPKDDLEQWLERFSFADLENLIRKTESFTYEELEPEEVEIEFDTFINTDLSNQERLLKRFGRDLKYTIEKGWFVWEGRRFVANNHLPMKLAKKSAKLIYQEAEKAHGKERKWLREWAKSSESLSKLKASVELMKSEVPFSFLDFDSDPYLFNCQNGILSLKDRKLINHHRKYLCHQISPVRYEPKATCPTWDKFLWDITGQDQEMIDFLHMCLGYSLTGLVNEEVFFFLWGRGRNGKSKFLECASKILGTYSSGLPMESLMDTGRSDTGRNDLASLVGARLVTASETTEGQKLNEALVKLMTGGDKVRCRNLFHEYFNMAPVWKVWFAGNHRPQIKGQDPAIWERLILIPFDTYIAPENRDPFLMQKLNIELPGILNRFLDGFDNYMAGTTVGGRTVRLITERQPKRVQVAGKNYQQDQDTILAWIEDCAVLAPSAISSARDLYSSYSKHCKLRGVYSKSDRAFYESLESRKEVTASRKTGGKMFHGIGLKALAWSDYSSSNSDREYDEEGVA